MICSASSELCFSNERFSCAEILCVVWEPLRMAQHCSCTRQNVLSIAQYIASKPKLYCPEAFENTHKQWHIVCPRRKNRRYLQGVRLSFRKVYACGWAFSIMRWASVMCWMLSCTHEYLASVCASVASLTGERSLGVCLQSFSNFSSPLPRSQMAILNTTSSS